MITMQRPQKIEVSAPGDLLAELFQHYSQGRQLKETTRHDTTSAIAPFLRWWEANYAQHEWVLNAETMAAYFAWFDSEYEHPINRYVHRDKMANKTGRMLRRIFRWAHQVGATPVDISVIVPLIRRPEYVPYFASLEDVKELVLSPDGHSRVTRDRAIFAFLTSTGCRRDELTHVTADDVRFWETNRYDLDPAHDHAGHAHLRIVKGRRVGGRVVCFDTVAGLLLKRWMVASGAAVLFDVTGQRIYDIVVAAAKAIDIPELTPHGLRRTFGNVWLQHNRQHGEVADLARRLQMGHQMDRNNISLYHYSDWRPDPHRPERTATKIWEYYTSPLKLLHDSGDWDWAEVG